MITRSHFYSFLGHDLNMIRLTGQTFSDMEGGSTHVRNLIEAAQGNAVVVHILARLPWLRSILFEGPLGMFLKPKPGDKSVVGQVMKVWGAAFFQKEV